MRRRSHRRSGKRRIKIAVDLRRGDEARCYATGGEGRKLKRGKSMENQIDAGD